MRKDRKRRCKGVLSFFPFESEDEEEVRFYMKRLKKVSKVAGYVELCLGLFNLIVAFIRLMVYSWSTPASAYPTYLFDKLNIVASVALSVALICMAILLFRFARPDET